MKLFMLLIPLSQQWMSMVLNDSDSRSSNTFTIEHILCMIISVLTSCSWLEVRCRLVQSVGRFESPTLTILNPLQSFSFIAETELEVNSTSLTIFPLIVAHCISFDLLRYHHPYLGRNIC